MTFIKYPAKEIPYDNSSSGLSSDNVQSAIDEIDGYIDSSGLRNYFVRFSNSSFLTLNDTDNNYFYAGISGTQSANSPLRSGSFSANSLDDVDIFSPYQIPFNGKIVEANLILAKCGVTPATPAAIVNCNFIIQEYTFSGKNDIAGFFVPITTAVNPVSGNGQLNQETDLRIKASLNIPVTEGQTISLLFDPGSDEFNVSVGSMFFVTFIVEEE